MHLSWKTKRIWHFYLAKVSLANHKTQMRMNGMPKNMTAPSNRVSWANINKVFWKNAHTQWQQCWKIGSVPVPIPISIPTLRDDSKWQLKKGKRQIFLRSNQNWYINNDDNNNNNGHQQIEVEWRKKNTHCHGTKSPNYFCMKRMENPNLNYDNNRNNAIDNNAITSEWHS